MTTYNPINGIWNASNYDLNTTILRGEWGFDGFVMTDWWAGGNDIEGEPGRKSNLKAMVRAQNDIFMVCPVAEENGDDIMKGLNEGFITIGQLQRNAKNILRYILRSPTYAKFAHNGYKRPHFEALDENKMKTILHLENAVSGEAYSFRLERKSAILIKATIASSMPALEQSTITCKLNGTDTAYYSASGGETITQKRRTRMPIGEYALSLEFEDKVSVLSLEVKAAL